jgi:death-on-curing protein
MIEPKWVSDLCVEAIHSKLLTEHGGPEGIRDKDLLASALARPKQKFLYDGDASIFAPASAYSFGIANNHPFVDRNKRAAFTIAVVFLELNGYEFHAEKVEAAITFEKVAVGEIDEVELSSWLEIQSTKS